MEFKFQTKFEFKIRKKKKKTEKTKKKRRRSLLSPLASPASRAAGPTRAQPSNWPRLALLASLAHAQPQQAGP